MNGHDDEAKQKFKVRIFEKGKKKFGKILKLKQQNKFKRKICVSFKKKIYLFTKYFGLARAEKRS